eukprot:SAG25_NODE_521_length_7225_cov_3.656890_4_plen_242_part_00
MSTNKRHSLFRSLTMPVLTHCSGFHSSHAPSGSEGRATVSQHDRSPSSAHQEITGQLRNTAGPPPLGCLLSQQPTVPAPLERMIPRYLHDTRLLEGGVDCRIGNCLLSGSQFVAEQPCPHRNFAIKLCNRRSRRREAVVEAVDVHLGRAVARLQREVPSIGRLAPYLVINPDGAVEHAHLRRGGGLWQIGVHPRAVEPVAVHPLDDAARIHDRARQCRANVREVCRHRGGAVAVLRGYRRC